MTGSEGTKHTKRMLKAGTKIVGGVTPGKGGQSVDMDGIQIPVFNSVAEAIASTAAVRFALNSLTLLPRTVNRSVEFSLPVYENIDSVI
jgi:succinyl-CoA synthetase alpha subunit